MSKDLMALEQEAETLAEQVCSLLSKHAYRLVTAESCTGGLLAGFLTGVAGSSSCFERGFITYSNQAKHELLAVPESILEQYGAVSKQTAAAMAEGALKHSQSQYALSITGIAGPDGGTDEKPVGTVIFGWAGVMQKTLSIECYFEGNRKQVRMQAVRFALSQVLQRCQQ